MRRSIGAALVGVLLVTIACSDDDTGAETDTVVPHTSSITEEPRTGGLAVPEVPGTFPVALPSVGFGIAIPDGWQATVLTDDALAQLADAALDRPSFLDAAHAVARTGAVFYAAGVDGEERVAELEVDVQDGADTSSGAVAATAAAVGEADGVTDVVVHDDLGDGRVRVDYRFSAAAAEGSGTIDAFGSQLFVPDGDRLWSFMVTSEDSETQEALLTVFQSSLVFG